MKILKIYVLLYMIVSLSSGSDFIDTKDESIDKLKFESILSGKHKNKILNIDFDKNNNLLSVSKNMVKIWDTNNSELVTTIDTSNAYVKARFSKNSNIMYVLSQKEFLIYDRKNLSNLSKIKKYRCVDFTISHDESRLFLLTYNKLFVYDLANNSELYSIKIYGKDISITPNDRYVYISNNKKIDIFQVSSGMLVNTIKIKNKPTKVFFADNHTLYVIYDNKQLVLYNFKTSKALYTKTFKENISSYYPVVNKKVSLFYQNNKNRLNLFNLDEKKVKNIIEHDLKYISKNGIKLSKDKSLLALGTNEGYIKVLNIGDLFNKKKITQKPISNLQVKKEPKHIIINQKPTLKIVASRTEGIIPFKVTFSIIANNIKNIHSYYINLAGEENMQEGEPPMTFQNTFNDVGSFKVFVAIKTHSGKIIENEIIINAKEETFSDFKELYQ